MVKTHIPHVFRIDLDGSGLAHECAIVHQDTFGNIYFLKISELDSVDRLRIGKVLQNRFINDLPLWDVMSQTTLKNGVNALTYFHQLVKAVTPEGLPFVPQAGRSGYSVNQLMQQKNAVAASQVAHAESVQAAKAEAEAEALIAKKNSKSKDK